MPSDEEPKPVFVERPVTWEMREAAWAIVKDAKMMEKGGHAKAVRWARNLLHLDD